MKVNLKLFVFEYCNLIYLLYEVCFENKCLLSQTCEIDEWKETLYTAGDTMLRLDLSMHI